MSGVASGESAGAGTVFPEQVIGGEHYRLDGPECAYLAQGVCNKCGGLAPLPGKWADRVQEAVPRPDVEFRQVSDDDSAATGEKSV